MRGVFLAIASPLLPLPLTNEFVSNVNALIERRRGADDAIDERHETELIRSDRRFAQFVDDEAETIALAFEFL